MIVVMGSGAQTAAQTAELPGRGRRAGRRGAGPAVPAVPGRGRCSRRCPPRRGRVAVLDRTKEPGSLGEPLFLDVLAALAEAHTAGERETMPVVTGGRYGLSSKEFTPGMVAGVFAELAGGKPRPQVHDRHHRRRQRDQPALRPGAGHRAGRNGAGGVLRAGIGRHRRREQEHHQDPRRGPAAGTRRGTSSTTPRSQAHRRSPTCGSGRTRSGRPTWSPRPGSSAATRAG